MALFSTQGLSLQGIAGRVVDVQADVANGLPAFTLVGLPDASLSEARDRVRAAVNNSGYTWPTTKVTVNLTPASLPKQGSGFDVSIATAVLGCQGVVQAQALHGTVLFGELGLDGRLRPSRGVLPAVYAAWQAGARRVVVPWANRAEANAVEQVVAQRSDGSLARGCEVVTINHLRQVEAVAAGASKAELEAANEADAAGLPLSASASGDGEAAVVPDLADVVGQPQARWALEIAAAGGHHLLMVGPPGSGKTMLACRLPGLLPALEPEHAVEVASLASLAGVLPPSDRLDTRVPFQQPHHTATTAALVGGGSGMIKPGAISMAHRGVLFLDEAPEFRSAALQALREPLESGEVSVARAMACVSFPARFLLVLAANPCPCGYGFGRGERCACPPHRKRAYFAKLSGPLIDRMDLRLLVQQPNVASLRHAQQGETTAVVRERVGLARQRSSYRLREYPWATNAEVPGSYLRRHWPARAQAVEVLEEQVRRGVLTLRGADRVLRVAWTLADLAGATRPGGDEVASALALRGSEVLPNG